MIRLNKSCPVVVSTASEITMTEQSGEPEQVVMGDLEQQCNQENQIQIGDIPIIPIETEAATKKKNLQGGLQENVTQLQNSDILVCDNPGVENQYNAVKNIVDTLRASTLYQNSRDLLKQVVECGRTMQQQQQQIEVELKRKESERMRAKIQRLCERQKEHDDGLVPSCIITANKNMLGDSTEVVAPSQTPDIPPTLPDYPLIVSSSMVSPWDEQQQVNPGLLNLIDHFRGKKEDQQINLNLNPNPQLPSLQNKAQQPPPLYAPELAVGDEVVSSMDTEVNASDQQLTLDALKKLVTDPETLSELGNLRNTITDTSSTFPIPSTNHSFSPLFPPPPLFQAHDRTKLKRMRSGKRKANSENFRDRNPRDISPTNSLDGPQLKIHSPDDSQCFNEEHKKFKGIVKQNFKWRARVCHQGKNFTLGLCDSPEDAARTYDQALILLKGPKLVRNKTNFPVQIYQNAIKEWEKQQYQQYKKLMNDPLSLKTRQQDDSSREQRIAKEGSGDAKGGEDYKPFSTVPVDGFRPVVTQPPKPHNKELRFANLMLHPDVVQIQRQVLEEWKEQERSVIELQNVLQSVSVNFEQELLPAMVDQLQDLLQINSKEELQSCQLPMRYLNIRDDLVELFRINDDDKRIELRGKLGVRARKNITAGNVLGILRGFMVKKEAYLSTLKQAEQQGVASFQLLEYKASQYLHEVDVLDDDRLSFMVTQYCYGNLLAEVNDPHMNVVNLQEQEYEQDNWAQQTPTQIAPSNADILHFQIAGFPVPVMVTTKCITAGEEILCSYGLHFWKLMSTVKSKHRNMISDTELTIQSEP